MPDADDASLLRRIAAGDREALPILVRRHADFVYSTARRRVGNAHLAEDITQAVFLILTAKASRLANVVLAGWLYRTTGYVAANAMKKRRRQEHYERRAAIERSETVMPPETPDREAVRRLEAALGSLRTQSRDALLLRFFRRQSLAEVAQSLGISEEAAKKRVTRAVDELRAKMSASSGATSPTAASTLALLTAIPIVSAPPAIAASILQPTSAATSLAKGAIFLMTAKQASIVAGVVVVLLIGTGAAVTLTLHEAPAAAQNPTAAQPATAPSVAETLVATFDAGTIEMLGTGDPNDIDAWLTPAGKPMDRPWDDFGGSMMSEPGRTARGFAYRTMWKDASNNATVVVAIDKANGTASGSTRSDVGDWKDAPQAIIANLPDTQTSATVRFRIATGPWTTKATFTPSTTTATKSGDGGIDLDALHADARGTEARFALTSTSHDDLRFVFVDRGGKEHIGSGRSSSMRIDAKSGPHMQITVVANAVKPEEVASIRMETRPFDHSVEFRDLPLVAGSTTKSSVQVGP